ncbi:MAG: tetratricopeptide repeat protein [Desulfomonilaceae bacterium]
MRYDSAAKLEGRSSFFDRGIVSALKLFPQRPAPILSFYANYLIGGMQPAYFRAVNLAMLAGTAVMVVLLINLVLTIPRLWDQGSLYEQKIISILVGLLYLIHPLQTFVTLYIWQRMALMACFFYYSSLAVYLAVRLGKIENKAAGYSLCIALFVCAMLSKENTVTLPVVCVMAEIAFFREGRLALLKRAVVYLGVLLIVAGLLSFLQHPHGDVRFSNGVLSTLASYYRESGVTLLQVVLTQCRVLFHYMAVTIAPLPGNVQLVNPQVLSRSLWEPPETLVAVLATAVLIAAGIYLLRKRPISGFGILFYLGNMIPEALLVPQYAFFGYRAVLPMLGLCLVLADCTAEVLDAVSGTKLQRAGQAALVGVCVSIVILLGSATVEGARIWSDEVRFWKKTVNQFPPYPAHFEAGVAAQALSNLGRALYIKGKYSQAVNSYQAALELRPSDALTLASLGAAYAKLGQLAEAESALKKALKICPELSFAHEKLGNLLVAQGRHDEAFEHRQKAGSGGGDRDHIRDPACPPEPHD